MKVKDVAQKTGKGIRVLMQGDAVSSKFFKRHFFATAFTVIACVAFIAARFECATDQNTIHSLKNQINVMSTEKQKERSLYMTLTRESAMMHLVDSLKLGLTIPDARPQVLTLDENQ
ncbi:MAG: hypothetical protein K2I39_08060 [Muribaculaceae bacterium]|nr:hypothetical protein [Muribaculaceae bacterium]